MRVDRPGVPADRVDRGDRGNRGKFGRRQESVDERLLDVLSGWREAPDLYTERLRAAIALTEEMTLIGESGVSDAVWNRAASAFTQQELVSLLMAISAINVWNRLATSTHQALPEPAA